MSLLTQVEVALARFEFFLLADVLSYSLLVQSNRAYAVPIRGPALAKRDRGRFAEFAPAETSSP